MAVRKIKGWWCVDIRSGKERLRKRSPHNTRAAARDYERHLTCELATKGSLDAVLARGAFKSVRPPKFAEFAERWFQTYVIANNKPSEQERKRRALEGHLLPAFGRLVLNAITADRIEGYKAVKRREGLLPKTVNNHLTVLRRCLASACEWDVLRELPRIKFLRTAEPSFRYLEERELSLLLDTASTSFWRAMILVAVRTGLRYSELIALEWQDVDLGQRMLRVRQAFVKGHLGSTKSNRIRHVPLTHDAIAALKALGSNSVGLVFQYDGRRVPYTVAWEWLNRFCVRASIRHVSWHHLRHTFASQLVASGAPIRVVQELLGHAEIRMTMRYSHLNPQILRDAITRLEASSPSRWAPVGHQPHDEPLLPSVRVVRKGTISRSVEPQNTAVWAVSDVVDVAGFEPVGQPDESCPSRANSPLTKGKNHMQTGYLSISQNISNSQ